jgi:hypothetical protein
VSENDFGVDEGPVLPMGSEPILGLGQPVEMTATANYAFTAKKSSQISFNKGSVFQVSEIQVFGSINLSTDSYRICFMSVFIKPLL